MKKLILSIVLSLLTFTSAYADIFGSSGVITFQDEGGTPGDVDNLNCVGSSIACTVSGTTGTITVSGGGGAVSSVANSDGTLTISPTTGSVVASLALGHANAWTGTQAFNQINYASGHPLIDVLENMYYSNTAGGGVLFTYDGDEMWSDGVTVFKSKYGYLQNSDGSQLTDLNNYVYGATFAASADLNWTTTDIVALRIGLTVLGANPQIKWDYINSRWNFDDNNGNLQFINAKYQGTFYGNYLGTTIAVAQGGTGVTTSTGTTNTVLSNGPTLVTPIFTTSPQFGTAGVSMTDDGDGAITFLGLGNGNDEDLKWNYDDGVGGANSVEVTSSTGVTSIVFTAIAMTVGTTNTNVSTFPNGVTGGFPSVQTIAATNTITADSCGGLKRITSSGAVTTSTTNTFTSPATGNQSCIMFVCNTGSNNITLDNNSNFKSAGGADVVMTADDCVSVGSTGNGGVWYQLDALEAN
jgi:hypothetical protein